MCWSCFCRFLFLSTPNRSAHCAPCLHRSRVEPVARSPSVCLARRVTVYRACLTRHVCRRWAWMRSRTGRGRSSPPTGSQATAWIKGRTGWSSSWRASEALRACQDSGRAREPLLGWPVGATMGVDSGATVGVTVGALGSRCWAAETAGTAAGAPAGRDRDGRTGLEAVGERAASARPLIRRARARPGVSCGHECAGCCEHKGAASVRAAGPQGGAPARAGGARRPPTGGDVM
jgi:hypothetical protein